MTSDAYDVEDDCEAHFDRRGKCEWADVTAEWRPSGADVADLRLQLKDYVRRSDIQALAERVLMIAYCWYFADHAPAVFLYHKRADIEDARQLNRRYANKLVLLFRDFDHLGGTSLRDYTAMTAAVETSLLHRLRQVKKRSSCDRSLFGESSLLAELNGSWNRLDLKKQTTPVAGFEKLLLWLFAWMKKTTEHGDFRCPKGIPTFKEKRSVRDMIDRHRQLFTVPSAEGPRSSPGASISAKGNLPLGRRRVDDHAQSESPTAWPSVVLELALSRTQ